MKYLLLARIPKNASVSTISLFENPEVKILQKELNNKESVNFAWTNTFHDPELQRFQTILKKTSRKTTEVKKAKKYWNKFYSFAFVRNPYDRAVSSWKFGSWKESWDCSFEEFTEKLLDIEDKLDEPFKGGSGLIHHCTKQYHYIHQNGKICIDYLGRVEQYKKEINFILEENQLPTVNWVPHRNKSKKNNYKLYYNSRSKKNIEKIYEIDIDTFKYNF